MSILFWVIRVGLIVASKTISTILKFQFSIYCPPVVQNQMYWCRTLYMVVVIILSFIIGKWVTQSSNNLSNCTQSWTSIAIFLFFIFRIPLFNDHKTFTTGHRAFSNKVLSVLWLLSFNCVFWPFIFRKLNKDKTDQTMPSQGKNILPCGCAYSVHVHFTIYK